MEISQAKNSPQLNAKPDSIIFTQVPRSTPSRSNRSFRGFFGEKSRIASLSSGKPRVLTPEFASAANPSLSFDGQRVLFAGRKTLKDKWNIWEMGVDGMNKRQITVDFGNCAEPRYLALSAITPPDYTDKVRWITFTSDAANTYEVLDDAPATALYVRNLEPVEGRGFLQRRTTFSLSSVFSPLVLGDGRVLFTGHKPAGGWSGVFPLLVTNWDGTGLNLFYRSSSSATLNSMTCEMPDRTLVFIESEQGSPDPGGRLARISFARPLHSYQAISKEPGKYCSPRALPDGRLLVSYKPSQGSYGLYFFDFESGAPGQKVYDDPEWDELEGLAVMPSREPQGLLSAVVDSEETGDLQCMNVFDTDMPEGLDINKGEVKRVRVVEGIPYSVGESVPPRLGNAGVFPLSKTRILGEIPVEPDGSFYVRVPADTPLFIQSLNDKGMSLQTLESWIWVRRGTSRGCIGCHEDKELAPENRATQALIKGKPLALLAAPEQRRRIDFRKDVMTILDRRCISCHGSIGAAGGIELTQTQTRKFNVAYERLLSVPPGAAAGKGAAYVVPGSARKSALLEMLMLKISMPTNGKHHPAASLTEEELRTLIEWIDLGAPWEN